MSSYDDWKATNPADETLGSLPEWDEDDWAEFNERVRYRQQEVPSPLFSAVIVIYSIMCFGIIVYAFAKVLL